MSVFCRRNTLILRNNAVVHKNGHTGNLQPYNAFQLGFNTLLYLGRCLGDNGVIYKRHPDKHRKTRLFHSGINPAIPHIGKFFYGFKRY